MPCSVGYRQRQCVSWSTMSHGLILKVVNYQLTNCRLQKSTTTNSRHHWWHRLNRTQSTECHETAANDPITTNINSTIHQPMTFVPFHCHIQLATLKSSWIYVATDALVWLIDWLIVEELALHRLTQLLQRTVTWSCRALPIYFFFFLFIV